jgi:hypothetical protein
MVRTVLLSPPARSPTKYTSRPAGSTPFRLWAFTLTPFTLTPFRLWPFTLTPFRFWPAWTSDGGHDEGRGGDGREGDLPKHGGVSLSCSGWFVVIVMSDASVPHLLSFWPPSPSAFGTRVVPLLGAAAPLGMRRSRDGVRRDPASTELAEHAVAFHRCHCTGVAVTVPWDES